VANRIIRESIRTSDSIDQLSWFEECMFYRLIVTCDDYGCMDARPKILASALFPLKDIRVKTIEDALRKFSTLELVTLYEVGGKPFLRLKTWDRHQRVRDSKHKYPTPDGETANGGEPPQSAATCGNSRQLAANGGEPPQSAARARAESLSLSLSESQSVSQSVEHTHNIQQEGNARARTREGAWFDPEHPDEECDSGWLSEKSRPAIAQRIMDWACRRDGFDTTPEEDEYGMIGASLLGMITGAMAFGIHPAEITKALQPLGSITACERRVAGLIEEHAGINGLKLVSPEWGDRAWDDYKNEMKSAVAQA